MTLRFKEMIKPHLELIETASTVTVKIVRRGAISEYLVKSRLHSNLVATDADLDLAVYNGGVFSITAEVPTEDGKTITHIVKLDNIPPRV